MVVVFTATRRETRGVHTFNFQLETAEKRAPGLPRLQRSSTALRWPVESLWRRRPGEASEVALEMASGVHLVVCCLATLLASGTKFEGVIGALDLHLPACVSGVWPPNARCLWSE